MEVRQSWQDLANELRNQIKTKQSAGEEAMELEMEVVKATFKTVSSLFLYQKSEFEKLSTKLHEAEKTLVSNINEHVANLKEKAKKLKSHLIKEAKNAKKTWKKMHKQLNGVVNKVTKKVNKEIPKKDRQTKATFAYAGKIIKKEQQRAEGIATELNKVEDEAGEKEFKTLSEFTEVSSL